MFAIRRGVGPCAGLPHTDRTRGAALLLAAVAGVLSCTSPGTSLDPAQGPVATKVVVSPGDTDLAPGSTLALTARVSDSAGHAIAQDSVVWSSSDTASHAYRPAEW